jgi:hypothetical protein
MTTSERRKAITKRKARAAQAQAMKSGATLSPATRQRLYDEAANSSSFEGMTPDEIKVEIDQRISRYLATMPWWFGRTDDSRCRKAQRAYKIGRGQITPNEQPEHLRRRRLSLAEQIALDEAEEASTEVEASTIAEQIHA